MGWVPINGNWIGRHSGKSVSSYWLTRHPELKQYVTGLSTPLSRDLIESIGLALNVLKSDLEISSLNEFADIMYFLDGDTEESSLKNIVGNNFHCIKAGTITWEKGKGVTGDGTTGHLKTGFKPKTHGVNFQLNSASIGVNVNTDIVRAQSDIGARKASNDDRSFINCQSELNLARYCLNIDSLSIGVSIISGNGLALVSRTSNILTNFYRDAKKLHESSVLAGDMPDYEIYIGAVNSADSINSPSNNQISFAIACKGLNENESDTILSALITYKSSYLKGIGYNWYTRKVAYDSVTGQSFVSVLCRNSPCILACTEDKEVRIKQINSTYVDRDDHNEAALLVRSSDRKLITVYTGHSTKTMWIKISANAADIKSLGEEVEIIPNPGSKYTYPNLYEVENGDIYLFYRERTNDIAGGWCWSYIKSTDGGETWGAQVRFSLKRYTKIAQDDLNKNVIHFLVCNHPMINTNPNTVSHFYLDALAGTFHKSDGVLIESTLPFGSESTTPIFSNPHPQQSWQEDIIVKNGKPRVLITYYPNVSVNYQRKYLYYSEWNGFSWTTPYELHLIMDRNIAVENIGGEESYGGQATFDLNNPDRIFASVDTDGKMEIWELTRTNPNQFTRRQITFNSENDQWRPFVTMSTKNNVLWLNKESYVSYINFNQSLVVKTI